MKYKLINVQTKEKHLCDKVTIEGYDYYVSDGEIKLNDPITDKYKVWFWRDDCSLFGRKKIIATNNPNIDIPKVVNDYKNAKRWAADLYGYDKNCELPTNDVEVNSFIEGYNKSQETHSNSDEDMVDFYEWCDTSEQASIFWRRNKVDPDMSGNYWKKIRENREKLFQLWKKQQPKKVYYE